MTFVTCWGWRVYLRWPRMGYHALLFCPEEKTARVVAQVLSELEFSVELSTEPFAAVKKLMAQHFDAIVVDCDNEQNATLLLKSARHSGSNQNSLAVAVVEGQTGVTKAFRIGANLVLTKPINIEHSKGTLRVARGLLRKADAAKPARAVSTSAEEPTRQITPVPPMQKSASSPVQPAPPSIPAPTASASSAFELEPEPAPPPGPAEAALLEYMPDSVPAAGNPPAQPEAVSPSSKEYAWQPVSKPLAEPMASALRRAAEAAARAEPDTPAAAKATAPILSVTDSAKGRESWPASSMSSGQGTATAPAPAKETPWPRPKTSDSKSAATVAPAPKKPADRLEPVSKKALATAAPVSASAIPTFASLDDAQDLGVSHAGGGKKTFLIAAIVLLLVAASYFGWTKMHPVSGQPSVQKQFAPVQVPAPTAIPQAESPNQQTPTPATAPSQSAPSTMSDQAQEAGQIAAAPNAKAASPKPSAEIATPVPATKATPTVKTQEPIVVKNDLSKVVNTIAAGEEPGQPPASVALGVGSSTNEKAISGIMSTNSVNLPKPVPQTLRVSQGISQGMLLKRVQPVYPQQARQLRLQGAVQLEASIGKDGSITKVKQISGDAVLGHAAVDAVKQWKYKPYYLNGEPVEIQTQITVNFKLP
jgi:periplasmic protein TonB